MVEIKEKIIMKKVIIFGTSGMLGQELSSLFISDKKYEVNAPTHHDLDLTNKDAVSAYVHAYHPDSIINAVAYNAVDQCEDDDEAYALALSLNRDVPEMLAQLSKDTGAVFVQYSTDYVFGRNEKIEGGFTEDTVPLPDCKYGLSKFLGESCVQAVGGKFYIIRLSRLFGKQASGSGKKSFFETMRVLSETKSELSAVDDEISCLTYAFDLAQATKELVESADSYGIYHLINQGAVSWYEGLSAFFSLLGKHTSINPVHGDTFVRKARRPAFSVLRNTKRPLLRSYKDACVDCIARSDILSLQ